MKLSILIPSIPERSNALNLLLLSLDKQIAKLPVQNEVEVLVLMDNKIMSIGEKRERLKNMAAGKYWSMIDDDDRIDEDYVEDIIDAINEHDVDVITFNSWVSVDGQIGTIKASNENPENEQFTPGKATLRKPSHVNCWRAEKFNKFKFGDSNYGEDFDFCNQCYEHIESEHVIDKVLHYYIYDSQITQAF